MSDLDPTGPSDVTDLAAVVLAAGAGSRLAPLTRLRPKALCPVATRPLVDHALARVATVVSDPGSVAVNLHHGGALLDAHLPAAVHRSGERPEALGTAGALGALRPWIDGRPVLVTNADAWLGPAEPTPPATADEYAAATEPADDSATEPADEPDAEPAAGPGTPTNEPAGHLGPVRTAAGPGGVDLAGLVAGWDGRRVRLLCVETGAPADFGTLRYCGAALLPADLVAGLAAEPSGLYEVLWRDEARAGRLDLVVHHGPFVDCGTPARYLEANLLANGGRSVVDPEARVGEGALVDQSVVWDHSEVGPGERLRRAIRAEDLTVLVR